jgi:hypothetical protein
VIKKKTGRNDPCPCGSGKKYKNCCLPKDQGKRITPIESFKVKLKKKTEIVDYHLESKNGRTWEKKPGSLLLRIHYRPDKTLNKEIGELFQEVTKGKSNLTYHIGFCNHKLYAVRYHIDNFSSEEHEQIEKYEANYSPPSGAQMINKNPKLVYEIESFLFQVKSSLDALAIGPFNRFLELGLGTFGIEKAIKALKENQARIGREKANELISIIKKNKDWIEELNEMRIQITHLAELEGFMCFLEMPYTGGEECVIYYPSMPDGTRAKTYMASTWKKLLSFYRTFLLALFS